MISIKIKILSWKIVFSKIKINKVYFNEYIFSNTNNEKELQNYFDKIFKRKREF